MKLRFSLRTMLILVTCVAALCWWRDRPRRLAVQFADAIEAGRYDEADAMVVEPMRREIAAFVTQDDRNRIDAQRERQSPADWLRGRCEVLLQLEDFHGLGNSMTGIAAVTSQGVASLEFDLIPTAMDLSPRRSIENP